jgi:hypothetical protein
VNQRRLQSQFLLNPTTFISVLSSRIFLTLPTSLRANVTTASSRSVLIDFSGTNALVIAGTTVCAAPSHEHIVGVPAFEDHDPVLDLCPTCLAAKMKKRAPGHKSMMKATASYQGLSVDFAFTGQALKENLALLLAKDSMAKPALLMLKTTSLAPSTALSTTPKVLPSTGSANGSSAICPLSRTSTFTSIKVVNSATTQRFMHHSRCSPLDGPLRTQFPDFV